MYVHQDSGLINVAYFKFNIDDAKGRQDYIGVHTYWYYIHHNYSTGWLKVRWQIYITHWCWYTVRGHSSQCALWVIKWGVMYWRNHKMWICMEVDCMYTNVYAHTHIQECMHTLAYTVKISYSFSFTGELDGNRPVPFRLTPNLAELVTSIGVSGPFTASMVATARCLATPSFKVNALLRAIMRDEIISWHKVSLGFELPFSSFTRSNFTSCSC